MAALLGVVPIAMGQRRNDRRGDGQPPGHVPVLATVVSPPLQAPELGGVGGVELVQRVLGQRALFGRGQGLVQVG